MRGCAADDAFPNWLCSATSQYQLPGYPLSTTSSPLVPQQDLCKHRCFVPVTASAAVCREERIGEQFEKLKAAQDQVDMTLDGGGPLASLQASPDNRKHSGVRGHHHYFADVQRSLNVWSCSQQQATPMCS